MKRDHPFVGTRAFKGLVLANLMVANWDSHWRKLFFHARRYN